MPKARMPVLQAVGHIRSGVRRRPQNLRQIADCHTLRLGLGYAGWERCVLPVSPQERTKITEQTTPGFRRDLDRLSADDRVRVLETLRRSYDLLRDNPRSFFARAQRPLPIHLKSGLTASLLSLRIGRDMRF